jgi:hypothetical protein
MLGRKILFESSFHSIRKAIVELDHLVITITQVIITFKELKPPFCPFDNKSKQFSNWKRLRWALEEVDVSRAV